MSFYRDLARVSYVHPTYCWDGFEGLKNLYVHGLPVLVGYRGNLYAVSITENATPWSIDPSYMINTMYKIRIWDVTNSRLAGEGTFDFSYKGGPMTYTMSEIKKAVRKAILQLNTEPTDFYK